MEKYVFDVNSVNKFKSEDVIRITIDTIDENYVIVIETKENSFVSVINDLKSINFLISDSILSLVEDFVFKSEREALGFVYDDDYNIISAEEYSCYDFASASYKAYRRELLGGVHCVKG